MLIALLSLASFVPLTYPSAGSVTYYHDDPYNGVSDIYPYDRNMQPLDGVRLYDQNGTDAQRCTDGQRSADARRGTGHPGS